MNPKYTWCGNIRSSFPPAQWKEAWWMSDPYLTEDLRRHAKNRASLRGGVFTVFLTKDDRLVLVNESAASWPDIYNDSPGVVAGPFETLDAAKVAYELLAD